MRFAPFFAFILTANYVGAVIFGRNISPQRVSSVGKIPLLSDSIRQERPHLHKRGVDEDAAMLRARQAAKKREAGQKQAFPGY